MKKKQTLEEEINAFLEYWDVNKLKDFFRDASPLIDLYNVAEDNDWVKEAVGEDDQRNVRLIRTVYLVSRIAEFHAGRLCSVNVQFKNLWKRLEKAYEGEPNGQEDKEITERHEEAREAGIVVA